MVQRTTVRRVALRSCCDSCCRFATCDADGGRFAKNSLGMVWMALSIWAMQESLSQPRSLWRWLCVANVFVLSGVSHIGAFAVTAVVLGGSLVAYMALQNNLTPSRKSTANAVKALFAVVVVTLFVAWLVPSQVQRIGTTAARVVGFSPATMLLTVVVYGCLIWVLKRLFAKRDQIPTGDLAIAVGPYLRTGFRFRAVFRRSLVDAISIMSAVPAAALLSLVSTKLQWDLDRKKSKVITAIVAVLAIVSPMAMQGPVISDAAVQELRELKLRIDNPAQTLVVAPHGLEFWGGARDEHASQKRIGPSRFQQFPTSFGT